MSTRLKVRVVNKTAAYTIKQANGDAAGTVFTNRGAGGSVTFTLPTPNLQTLGDYYDFRVRADQSLIVAAAAANTLVTPGDVTADNVGFQIANKKVGRGLRVVCLGDDNTFAWYAFPLGALDGFCVDGAEVAPTIAGATLTSATLTSPTITNNAEVVAAAGADQAGATAITANSPAIVHATGADGAKGVKLPAAAAGKVVFIKNADAANAILLVYPATGDGINAVAVNSALSMAAKTAAVFVAIDATTWFTFSLLPS